MNDYPIEQIRASAHGFDEVKWIWDCVTRFSNLDVGARDQFWHEFLLSIIPETVLCQAHLFAAMWNSERFWDHDPEQARGLLLIFNFLEDKVTQEESDYLAAIKRACPYLREIHFADEFWTDYELPGEVGKPAAPPTPSSARVRHPRPWTGTAKEQPKN